VRSQRSKMLANRWESSALRKALIDAVPAMAGTLASFLITYALCVRVGTNASPAILSAVLCLGISRAPERHGIVALLRRCIAVPVIALGVALIGATFLRTPVAGAVLFTLGMSASVALREYGRVASAMGRTIALTLIAMLVVPVQIDRSAGILVSIALLLAAAIVAQLCAWGATALASIAGVTPSAEAVRLPRKKVDKKPEAGKLSATHRMALQMLVALALAFAIGITVFRLHWPWVVLSAFIVTSGAIGRGDALYKALLRVAGAIAGTLVAELLTFVHVGNSVEYAMLIFAVLFVGIWLRQINYAYWAACATLLFALLQGPQSAPGLALFGTRVLCILLGAACGVAATWFVVPIRSSHVVRRRLADAMGDMRDVLTGETRDLEHHTAQLERIAPAWRLHRTVLAREAPHAHPATWIERAHALLAHMRGTDFDRRKAGADLKKLRDDVFGERRE
jgi:Fusaric acid resistance protein-like